MRTESVSALSPESDALITRIIGCALTVHRELGPGFLEMIYSTALGIELRRANIQFEREKPIFVNYRGTPIAGQRVDFVVDDAVLLEIKAVTRIDPVFQAKVISYLRTTGLRVGLLINFNIPLLKNGIQRIVV